MLRREATMTTTVKDAAAAALLMLTLKSCRKINDDPHGRIKVRARS